MSFALLSILFRCGFYPTMYREVIEIDILKNFTEGNMGKVRIRLKLWYLHYDLGASFMMGDKTYRNGCLALYFKYQCFFA